MHKCYSNFTTNVRFLTLLIPLGIFGAVGQIHGDDNDDPVEAWNNLFGEKQTSLRDWQVLDRDSFADHGEVLVEDGTLLLKSGDPATGVRYKGQFPKTNYELTWEGKRVDGSDFFASMTFPVGGGSLTFVTGGWGGWVVGLSCIDGQYAIDNDTCQAVQFKNDQWYKFRVQVTPSLVKVSVDDQQIIELPTEGHEFSVSDEMKSTLPLGIATWKTTGAVRNVRYRQMTNGR